MTCCTAAALPGVFYLRESGARVLSALEWADHSFFRVLFALLCFLYRSVGVKQTTGGKPPLSPPQSSHVGPAFPHAFLIDVCPVFNVPSPDSPLPSSFACFLLHGCYTRYGMATADSCGCYLCVYYCMATVRLLCASTVWLLYGLLLCGCCSYYWCGC